VTRDFRDRFAIVGVGVTPTARTHAEGRSSQEMEGWAVKLALEDAGLGPREIDGAVHALAGEDSDSYSRKLGLQPNFFINVGRGTAAISSLLFATQAVATGNATCVAVSLTTMLWSAAHAAGGTGGALVGRLQGGLVDMGWTAVPGAGAIHALYASRHMHEFGTTEEQLGSIALANRAWANLNPEARFHDRTMTMQDYLDSRWVLHPLRLFDHCVTSDIGVALIVTTAERAKELGKDPVYIKGVGLGDVAREAWWDKTNVVRTDARHARDVAFAQAGITIDDVDVAQVYDSFTPEMLLQVEDYGWCDKGEGGQFFESGATAPGGKHPMNTYGGLLSGYHAGDGGLVVEAVRQLRGECGERQVAGAEIALATQSGGGMVTPWTVPIAGALVLGNKPS
jgi:acetyl-CoA acetyltransferase